MATKTGSKERKVKQSKKFRGDDDYELLHSSRVYKLWYEFLLEAVELEKQLKIESNYQKSTAWNGKSPFIKYWTDAMKSKGVLSGALMYGQDIRAGFKKYKAWAISGGIDKTLKTYSADQWRKEIFGTAQKKGDKWKTLFGVKKTVAASKVSPGKGHAKSGNQSVVSKDEILIKINLAENSRKDIDDAIQEILSSELEKLSRGRGKSIKKTNEAQFQITGVVDVRALSRCLALGKWDRTNMEYRTRKSTEDMYWRDLSKKFEEYELVEADHELTKAQFRKANNYTDKQWDDSGEYLYYEEVGDIQKKLDGKLNRMISRDRNRFKQVMVSVLEGRFDVS